MNRRQAGIPVFPLSLPLLFLPIISACDPEYNLCVVTTSCVGDLPIAGAHVRIQAYAVDGHTDSAGKICHHELNFPKPFEIEVDAPGFLPETEGPFQFNQPGTTDFQATVCLDPPPSH